MKEEARSFIKKIIAKLKTNKFSSKISSINKSIHFVLLCKNFSIEIKYWHYQKECHLFIKDIYIPINSTENNELCNSIETNFYEYLKGLFLKQQGLDKEIVEIEKWKD